MNDNDKPIDLHPFDARTASSIAERERVLSEQVGLPASDGPVDEKVSAFLARVIPAIDAAPGPTGAGSALIPWVCDVLLSENSVLGYGRDLAHFVRHLRQGGVDALEVTADHVRLYKAALLKAGLQPTTVARRLSVLRGAYRQFAVKGLVRWDLIQELGSVKAPPVAKNSTPALTSKQAVALLKAIPDDTLQGVRDLALFQTYFITGCRVSALLTACVGHLEFDGVEHYLHVTEKRNRKARKILLDAARAIARYLAAAGISADRDGPLFRPLSSDGVRFERRPLNRKTPWRW